MFHGGIVSDISILEQRGTLRKLLLGRCHGRVDCSTEIALLPTTSGDLSSGPAHTEKLERVYFAHCYLYIHTLLFSYGH
jgi:hypothetical protein